MTPWAYLTQTQMASPSAQPILQMTIVSLYFTTGRLFPKNCPFPWGIWTQSDTRFPEPTRVLNLNGISIGSAVFAGLTSVTDRLTD